MLTRSYRVFLLGGAVSSFMILSACQKVPLLAPSGSIITLTASTTALPVNGTTQLIAQVIESSGTPPHTGTQVSFTTTLGTIEPADASTDANGRVIVTFKAGTANGTATIMAISGGASVSAANAVKIAVGTAAVGRVNMSANPSLIPALGGSATITTTVFDINGNPLPSAPVTYSTTSGTLDPTAGTTDANGAAVTILRTSSKATVTASVGAQNVTPPSTTPGTTPPSGSTSGQASGTVTVDVAGAPGLVITPPSTPATSGLPATFSFVVTPAAVNGSAIRSVTVNWGDGATQDLGAVTGTATVSHTYRSAGSYTITATATDGSGNVVTVSTAVTVNQTQLALTITPPATPPTAGLPAIFTIVVGTLPAGDSVRSVRISWGDGAAQDLGAVSGSTTVSHVFQTANTYNVTGTLTDTAGNSITVSTAVIVNPTQVSLTITAPSVTPSVGLPAAFTIVVGTLPPGDAVRSVTVDWGDGKTSDLGAIVGSTTVSHVFATADTYKVSATLLDTVGSSTTVSTSVTVVATSNPTIIITPTVPSVPHPTDVTFLIQVTTPSGVGITRATIQFETGGPVTELGGLSGSITLHHTYTAAGSFTVTVTVTDTLGRTTQGTTSVTIS